uniref:Uncharacterized protein n=1 Tax=Oryza meridionalis TaxID=40149 RepID=A0A0E0EFQ9_9ORYZ
MRRSLRHPHAVADDAAADHPLVSSLQALRRLVFSPAAAAAAPAAALPAAVLRPFLDAVRSEDAGATVTSASLAALHEVMVLMDPSLTSAALREWACRQLLVRGRGRGRRRGGRADADAAVAARLPARTRRHRPRASSCRLQRFSRHAMHELIRCVFARNRRGRYAPGALEVDLGNSK